MKDKFPFEDRDLYLKHIKNSTTLIPIQEMFNRETEKMLFHTQAMYHTVADSLEWKWRKQLAANADKRAKYWSDINRNTAFSYSSYVSHHS